MAQRTVFYSWQSDLPKGTNHSFIESCLGKAIKDLRASGAKMDACLDRDTIGVPGSPDISATILDKIDNCHAFVCDASIIQAGPRPTPNPNVMFELGYAVKKLSWDRVICVINEHFGKVETLPFDVRQRRVLNYTLSPDTTDRKEVTQSLTADLRRELERILTAAQDEGERLQLQFGDPDTKSPLGKLLVHKGTYYDCDPSKLPDYTGSGGSWSALAVSTFRPNRDFHRQSAEYIQQFAMLREVGLVVFNGNRAPMNDLTLLLEIKKTHGLVVLDEKPLRPSNDHMNMMMRAIRPVTSHFARPGKVTMRELSDRYEVEVEFGKVQAEANTWSDPIYVGTSESCNLSLTGELYADELAAPQRVPLGLSFDVSTKGLDDLSDEEWIGLLTEKE